MTLWKITEKGPTKIQETTVKKEKLLEENLEDWIVADPTILGEPLLIIGRQVLIPDTKDRLDLLALAPHPNLKLGTTTGGRSMGYNLLKIRNKLTFWC